MTVLSAAQRHALLQAAGAGLSYALWRDPDGAAFTLVIATDVPTRAPVFGGDTTPGFVLAPFDTDDGNMAWHITADIRVTETVTYRSGDQFRSTPTTPAQIGFTTRAAAPQLRAAPDTLAAPAPTPRPEYEARVARAVAAIKAGQADKIVLSRIEPRDLGADHDLIDLVTALAAAHPHAFVSLSSSPATGTWLTATPEVLLSADAAGVATMALAGTQWPEPGVDIATLKWPRKIVQEQALVSDFIRDAFADAGITGITETPAGTVRAANLCHLRSDFTAPPADASALAGLLRGLHPTSAVCGMPKPAARDFILGEEGATRGFYTGYLGPVNLDGATRLYVNLRSARVSGNAIYLHVGGGIVAASDPALEYEETVQKTRTIAQVL